ncbi:hypothetical protein D3C72_1153850 [compost metagenome]
MPEALGAEIIGDAVFDDQLQTLFDGSLVTGELCQAQSETVGRVRTALQLAFVSAGLEDFQRVVFCRGQIRVGLARQLHAEPLARQRLTILEPGIADGAQRHAGSFSDPPCRLLSIQAALLHPDPQVFAVAAQGNIKDFIDLEIFRDRLQYRCAEGFAIGTRAE